MTHDDRIALLQRAFLEGREDSAQLTALSRLRDAAERSAAPRTSGRRAGDRAAGPREGAGARDAGAAGPRDGLRPGPDALRRTVRRERQITFVERRSVVRSARVIRLHGGELIATEAGRRRRSA